MTATATAARERGIIMGGESVRAILDGQKTVTRRVMNPQPEIHGGESPAYRGANGLVWGPGASRSGWANRVEPHPDWLPLCPFGVSGDRLWVREAWRYTDHDSACGARIQYEADGAVVWITKADRDYGRYTAADRHSPDRKRSPIHMPRWASRLTLEIASVRVERVQEITEEDAKAEGATAPWIGHDRWDYTGPRTHRDAFRLLWDRLNASRGYGWDVNPWVWRIEFRPVEAA